MPTCESFTSFDPKALGIAPTFPPMPSPLSRTQFVIVRFPMPPDPAVAASAPSITRSRSAGRWPKLKKPASVRIQCEAGTKATFTPTRKTKM